MQEQLLHINGLLLKKNICSLELLLNYDFIQMLSIEVNNYHELLLFFY